jgi:hypothetical protein
MKNSIKIIGLLLLLLVGFNGILRAQRAVRGMLDTTRLDRPGRGMYDRQMRSMRQTDDSLRMRDKRQNVDSMHMRGYNWFAQRPGMGRDMGHGQRFGMGRDMRNGQRYGMKRDMGRRQTFGMRNYRPGNESYMRRIQMGPGMMSIENIPDLTEQQKKDIIDLRQKQQLEMKKFRDEMSAKIQSMRESHRNMLLDQLTDEQKKIFQNR